MAPAAEDKAAQQTVRLGYVNFPPFTYSDEHGKPQGIFIEQAQKHFTSLQIKLTTVELPAKRLYTYLGEGKIDLFIGIKTAPQIQGKVICSEHPVGIIKMNLYYKKQDEHTLQSIADAKRLNIGAIRGYSYGSIINELSTKEQQNTLQYVTDRQSGYGMLQLDRINAFLDYEGPSKPFLEQLKEHNIQQLPLMNLSCYYVLNKNVTHAQQIVQQLDGFAQQLKRK